MKKELEPVVFLLGFLFFLGALIPSFREGMAFCVNIVFGPVAGVLPFHYVILLLASITGFYAALIQKYTVDWETTRRVQARVKAFYKEYREALLTKNRYKLKRLEKERAAIQRAQMEVTRQNFKPTFYIIIVSLPLFFWMWWYLSHGEFQPLVLPLIGEREFHQLALSFIPYWVVWYGLCSLPVGQLFRKILGVGGFG
jgi:uncharacterized membrane protein (DUF106 family)